MADAEQITAGAAMPLVAASTFSLSEGAARRITVMLAGEADDSFFRVAVNGGMAAPAVICSASAIGSASLPICPFNMAVQNRQIKPSALPERAENIVAH